MTRFKRFIATTQERPLSKVYNILLSIQGNRYVFYTMEFPIKIVELDEFDFEDLRVNLVKKKKLKWLRE
ncbi:hypothetical protein MSBRW_1124 [Methanosarcina barkeri str. Wiesmoor]|uniref:Uncharacterized protein n=1 Tax=Methanosarcina barkeri str. Wiesmoor TaxID=1434109 RepID=A0A0E3QI31_METBA|nr:hypothetical protein [Methanosarcina barkeri]AKB50377.1 hypothetical protein MSBRW_1124 [Methanosarcina barkeri str. Wiesmoor]